MTNTEPVVKVVFRVWPKREGGDVIALFPELPADMHGNYCDSYQHIGQHGGADYHGVIYATRAAKPEEYASLKRELESSPYSYNLRVVKRANWRDHDKRRAL